MPTLSTTAQAQLQSAIDLLVQGTARELPLSEDVIQRIAPVFDELGMFTVGGAYEALRNNPFSTLINLVETSGVTNEIQLNALLSAARLMTIGTAYETPLSEDVIERLAIAAENSGFLTKGGLYEAVKLNPISTLLRWSLKLGSA